MGAGIDIVHGGQTPTQQVNISSITSKPMLNQGGKAILPTNIKKF